MGRVVRLSLLLVLGLSASARAQERSAPFFLRVGAALGYRDGEGSSDGGFGPFAAVEIGVPVSKDVDLTADAILQPFDFGALFAMAGVQLGFGERRRTYVRPMAGVVVAPLSGGGFWPDPSTAPAIGIAVGHESSLGERLGLVVEIGAGFSSDTDDAGAVVSAGVHLVPLGARRRE